MFYKFFDKGHASRFKDMLTLALSQMDNPYVIKGARGRVIEFVPHEAISELLLNAIIHQDFNSDQNVSLKIFEDRVEITNPGETLIKPDRIIDRHSTRNLRLLRIMQRFGMATQEGAGIDRVISILEREHAAPLEIDSQDGMTKVTLFHGRSYRNMTRHHKKMALYQHCVLKHLAGEMMTNASARSRFNLNIKSRYTIWRLTKELLAEGKIKPSDENKSSNKYASYLPYWA